MEHRNQQALRAAQQAWDNMTPPDDFELSPSQEKQIGEVLDNMGIEVFVENTSNEFYDVCGKRLSQEAQKLLADSIHDLIAAALEVAL